MVSIMEYDDGEIKTYSNGVWELLRHLASAIFGELAIEVCRPEVSYQDGFLAKCYRLPDEPAA